MPEERENNILVELKRRAKEDIRYGSMTIDFTIHNGVIVKGELREYKISLG